MAVTRINNNQITDSSAGNVYVGINAGTKLQDYSITAGKIANSLTYGSDLTITGNLTVNGQTTTIDTVSTVIEDPVIVLASNQTGTPAVDIGFIGERGDQNNIAFVWDESADEFVTAFTTDLVTNTTVTISSYANFHTNDANIGGNLAVGGNISITGNVTSLNVTGNITGGNLLTPGVVTATGNVTGGNINTAGQVAATGNVTGGNLITAGLTDTGTLSVSSTSSFTGNITSALNVTGNITGGNLITAGNVYAPAIINNGTYNTSIELGSASGIIAVTTDGNTTQFLPGGQIRLNGAKTIYGGTLDGSQLVLGTAQTDLVQNRDGNVTVQVGTGGTTTSTWTFTNSGNLLAPGNIVATGNVTGGNVTTAGQVVATGNITGGNLLAGSGIISTTGNVTGGNIISPTVTGGAGTLTLNATGDVIFAQSGNINATNSWINNLVDPVQAQDAATKQYVDDAVSSGITIHTPVRLESPTALSGTYAQGGTTATVTATVAGNTVVFGSAIDPQVNDQLWFTNSFEGITSNTPYFVVSAPNTSAAVLSATYSGLPVTSITSNTGLTQAVRINSGQGATLTNSGANVTLVVDGVTVANSDRILVYQQANAAHNGVYVVSNAGNATSAWQLTRSSDMNTYVPNDIDGLDAGDYFYVTSGDTGAGESYVLTAPVGPTIIGYANLTFTQFSASQVYTANTSAGLSLTGTVFSAKVDNISTAFDGSGNIVVKAGAVLTTPNIGAATGTSLNVTGNVDGGNINTGGTVNATGNINGTGAVFAGNVTASNFIGNISGNIDAGGANTNIQFNDGDVLAGSAAFTFDKTSNAVVASGNITGSNLNTAGQVVATGNVTGGNLITTGLGSFGTTVTATGNITGGNVGTAGQVTATGNITGGNVIAVALVTGANVTATSNVSGANVVGTTSVTGGNIVISGDDITDTNGRVNFNTAGADVDFAVNGDAVANIFFIDAGTGTASFGSATQTTNAVVAFNATNSVLMPVGNVAQRPGTGVTGMLRFNTTADALEVYDNAQWTTVGVPSFTVIADEQFAGDGSTVAFTLGSTQTTASCIVSINGVVQIPTIAYSVSGTTLTFTEAPEPGDIIDVREITTTTTVTSISNLSGNASIGVSDTTNDVSVTGDLVVAGSVSASSFIGLDATSIANGTSSMTVIASGGNIRANVGGATVGTFYSGGLSIPGIINSGSNGVGNIGSSTGYFNTIFAQATSAQYADLAEKYVADAEYVPGTVVVFGGDKEVTVTSVDADRSVAGVISTNPSYIMNGGLQAEYVATVALTGRVPCRVTGAVRKGDMMVSAGYGLARAEADPRVGTVIGKALENHEGNEGVIEVVVGRF